MSRNEVVIPLGRASLGGELELAADAPCLVIFAHGSGSSRRSPRNQYVARVLRQAGMGTFLFDLLTAEEERAEAHTGQLRFDISFLAERLMGATQWALDRVARPGLKVGYFGASTGAAAALVAAAEVGSVIHAVISRGGRPDLAGAALEIVSAPTLLLVGEEDREVIALNRSAYQRLRCPKAIEIVPGATHLFEEPGALEEVANKAAHWFVQHFHKP